MDRVSVHSWRVTLGIAVRDERHRQGLSQWAAGARSGVSLRTWQRMETGHAVSDEVLCHVEDALGWKPGECFKVLWQARRCRRRQRVH